MKEDFVVTMDKETFDQYVVLTKWGCKWIKFVYDRVVNGGPAQQFANDILKQFDEVSCDPLEYVEEHTTTYTKRIVDCTRLASPYEQNVVKTKKVLKKGRRSLFSASIAKLAYNKYGERKMSEANVLVTRRWIQKLLEEPQYSDLRTCDKNLAIDRALFLSFVPTKDFQMMRLAISTPAWEKRNAAENVFGRVFRLLRGSSDAADLDLL